MVQKVICYRIPIQTLISHRFAYCQDCVENRDKFRKTKNDIVSDTVIWAVRDFESRINEEKMRISAAIQLYENILKPEKLLEVIGRAMLCFISWEF